LIVHADTSGLAKLLLNEDGSPEMRAAGSAADRLVSAAIAYVELRAAVAAALRAGRIPETERQRLARDLERVWGGVIAIDVDEPLLRRAGDLAEQMGLRAYDAVHLASLVASADPDEAIFACWDADLRRAARALGYPLLPA
jgi:predicted nucleic acid-binding protein